MIRWCNLCDVWPLCMLGLHQSCKSDRMLTAFWTEGKITAPGVRNNHTGTLSWRPNWQSPTEYLNDKKFLSGTMIKKSPYLFFLYFWSMYCKYLPCQILSHDWPEVRLFEPRILDAIARHYSIQKWPSTKEREDVTSSNQDILIENS